jgi:NAD(P)-dependent dehydrogenase (short-subunit alcohol dehydrogenase family)
VTSSRVAIVTGGGTGIGAAAAKLLAGKGLDVALVGRRREPLDEVRASIEEAGGRAIVVPVDVGAPDAPQQIVDETLAAFGQIDVVVNNAAVIRNGPLGDVTRKRFEEHYAVNVGGPFFLVQAALPSLRASSDAAVVNISSSLGSIVMTDTMLYGSTKASLEYLTRAWAYELARDGIRVNCVAPGPVDTPIHATYSDDLAETYAYLSRRIPLNRMGTPEDVAVWIWSFCDPETSWATGNVVHVDGGQVLGLPES